MKVYWNHPDLKPNVKAVGFLLSSNRILFIEWEVNWEIIKKKIRVGKDLCAHEGQAPGAAVDSFPVVKSLMFCPLKF